MGIGLRIFVVHDNDSIQRLSLACYERLIRRDPEERLPQYAGKRIRYAMTVLELANRKPVEIIKIQYALLSFDSEGRSICFLITLSLEFVSQESFCSQTFHGTAKHPT
jgi:hypothetical protein